MPIVATKKSEQNEAWVDPWTLVHFSAGLASGLMNLSSGWGLAIAVAYELGEHMFESTGTGQKLFAVSGPETIANSVIDVAVFALGAGLGRAWNNT